MAQSDRGAGGRRAWAWALAALVAIGVLAGAMVSGAESRARVVIVSGDYSALGRKLHAEAAAAGFDVIEPASAIDPPSGAELLARHQAAAVIRVVTEDRVNVEFEPAEGATARSLTRRGADGDSFALRVIEELYARLVERGVVPPPEAGKASDSAPRGSRAEAAPLHSAAPSRAPAADRPVSTESSAGRSTAGFSPRLWLLAGAGATQPAGGISGTLHGAIGARLEPMPRVAAAAYALLPLTENNLSGPEGSADVKVNLFLGEIGYVVLEQPRELSLEAGIGAGVLVLASQGEAPAPRSGKDLRTTAGLYFGHSSLAWKVSSWFRLRGSVLGGISAPRPVLRFEGREVAAWGRPFVAATLASEFGLSLSAPERSR